MPFEFPNCTTHSAAYTVFKMASQLKTAQDMLWIHKTKYMITLNRFKTAFEKKP
jgi:hypothetical protein